MNLTLPSAHHLSRLAFGLLVVLIATWGLLCLAALVFMTLATDEAWVLIGLRSLLRPVVPDLSSELIATSGGLFALLNLAVEGLLGGQLWAHRLVSLMALGLACWLALHHSGKDRPSAAMYLLGLAVLLLVPGLAEVGTTALGTSVAMALAIASMLTWTSTQLSPVQRAVMGGLLYGLAAASRFDWLLLGVAVLLCSLVRRVGPRRVAITLDLWAILYLGLGLSVFGGLQLLMALAPIPTPTEVTANISGLSGWSFNYPKILNHWHVLVNFAPPALLAALILSSSFASTEPSTGERHATVRMDSLLLVAGVVLLIAWLFRAPIPHLRYAMPGLFCLAALGARSLMRVAQQSSVCSQWRQLLVCQGIALACAAGSVPSLMRSVVMSDSDYASWEWSREMSHDYFRRFEAWQDQQKIVSYLRHEVPAEARVYSAVPYALRYLTERPVVDIAATKVSSAIPASTSQRLLVLSPAVGTFFHLRPESAVWLQQHAVLIKQVGRYSVYRLPAENDQDLRNIQLVRSNYYAHPGSTPWFGR
jgi:hypothetical protein